MAKHTHKKTSKRSGLIEGTAKRSRMGSKSVTPRNGVARNGNDQLKQIDKANAHLMKALEMIRESRARAKGQ